MATLKLSRFNDGPPFKGDFRPGNCLTHATYYLHNWPGKPTEKWLGICDLFPSLASSA
jgi:hypothetical protein